MSEEDTVTVYEAPSGWQLMNIEELWHYRELLYYFTWRDVKIRYKQTMLGIGWAIIQPFMMMVVFTIFLGKVANVDSGRIPYPVFVYAGLLLWTLFSSAISNSASSVVNASGVITKVYFPRLLLPLSAILAAGVDFVVAFLILLLMMLWFDIQLTWNLLLLPLPLVLTVLCAVGVGVTLSAVTVAYRDFRYTVPFMIQLWLFATPTVYMNTSDFGKEPIRFQTSVSDGEPVYSQGELMNNSLGKWVLGLNPMSGVVAFFRATVLGGALPWTGLGYSIIVVTTLLPAGLTYFRRVEVHFSDVI